MIGSLNRFRDVSAPGEDVTIPKHFLSLLAYPQGAPLADAELRTEFARHRGDLVQLDALNRELNSRDTDEAFDLQIEIVQVLTNPRKAAKTTSKGDSVIAWLKAFLLSHRMSAADERPLHQYRMSYAKYQGARLLLKVSRPSLTGTMVLRQACLWPFARSGFGAKRHHSSFAGLPLRRMYSEPFPKTAVGISEYGSSSLAEYLRKLMRFALAGSNHDHVRGFVGDISNEIRISLRQDGFINLCCKLILKLVEWKRMADEGPAGVGPLSSLDAQHPGWKDSLPIYIPGDDDRITSSSTMKPSSFAASFWNSPTVLVHAPLHPH